MRFEPGAGRIYVPRTELHVRFVSEHRRSADELGLKVCFARTFSRQPDQSELGLSMGHLKKFEKKKQEAYEDIIWALINTKEFMFNH